ncbi:hypothetical protein [Streptomyces sp. NPDC006012]|uniref:hypothetical protein n=1 Tax=Streptomyces sp. NPDC006012 TaxID=3364739 RepID=UPI0036B0B728
MRWALLREPALLVLRPARLLPLTVGTVLGSAVAVAPDGRARCGRPRTGPTAAGAREPVARVARRPSPDGGEPPG